jgi:hypothetical protein
MQAWFENDLTVPSVRRYAGNGYAIPLSPAYLPQIADLSRIAERKCTTRLTLVFADLKNTGRTLKESCRDNKKQANQPI